MPPRYAYWTIIAGGLPTAFRAADREELLPTFIRLKQKHPDAEMKWFARGRLWESPESARHDAEAQRRGRDWRPGGEHRDPRQKFKDAKKARNAEHRKRKFERRQRFAESDRAVRQFSQPPAGGGDRRPNRPRRPDGDRFRGPRTFQQKSFTRNHGRGDQPSSPPPEPRKEPRPREGTEPTPPPRPSEPVIPPPGPPERGRSLNRPSQQRRPFNRGGRRR